MELGYSENPEPLRVCVVCVLPLSSQESDWKELSDWTSELLPLLLPEKHVTSSAMSTILPVERVQGVKRARLQNRHTCRL